MFNCVVSQSLSAINSAAVSIKIISTDLWVFLNVVIRPERYHTVTSGASGQWGDLDSNYWLAAVLELFIRIVP
jgi:hypothetical protein